MQPQNVFAPSLPSRIVPTGHYIVAGRSLLTVHCAVVCRSFIATLSLLRNLLILTHHFIISTIHTPRLHDNLR